MGEMFIWSKLGQNSSEIDVRSYTRIKNVIWDQLLATKAEIVQSWAVLSCVQSRRWFCNLKFLFLFNVEGNIQCAKKVLRLASAIECADGDKLDMLDRGYFASSNGGIFSGNILKPQRFNIGQGIFSLGPIRTSDKSVLIRRNDWQNLSIKSHRQCGRNFATRQNFAAPRKLQTFRRPASGARQCATTEVKITTFVLIRAEWQ